MDGSDKYPLSSPRRRGPIPTVLALMHNYYNVVPIENPGRMGSASAGTTN